ncbi:MAG: precorrin-6y C5,15-methyltransferase (decarboxylating) subunit CbiE [Nitratireductor sp.]|nr:precorrin-6y C5,15-methyltransferase (decarboxylating) subunit CbiE [Nitratireductor sp.]MCB1438523.1 precorrin-6y C5,15-methyltransferase (decarboxylating) subunit CbiE [Nitratireductor sp.]MCC0019963.1 precorrin-6y C5,15-methyltransferase (decarboxylating) subunit CbiE [Nitratireductor sp.]
MSTVWLSVIGVGEDGVNGLSRDARVALDEADVVIGGERHHELVPELKSERVVWPSPFSKAIELVTKFRGSKTAILVSGDPLWFSAGSLIQRHVPADEIRYFPQLSSFQWAAARMGWSLADVETVTVHGRPAEQIIPHFAPGVRLLVLTADASSPSAVAQLLVRRGFPASRMVALAALGGPREKRFDGVAADWAENDPGVPDFHLLAVECVADPQAEAFSRIGGLPDHAFRHDGQLTKRVVRAATLSALQPFPHAHLWDIGAGCGSIGIEWMRAAREATCSAIEENVERMEMMSFNALELGAPRLRIIAGSAPDALEGLPEPDAVFIGGGLTDEGVFDTAWQALKPGRRLVANAVTLESESKLFSLYEKFGGTLDRIFSSDAVQIGRYHAMRPGMAVTQWAVVKR